MIQVRINQVKLAELEKKFSRSKAVKKHDISLAEALEIAHPSNKDGMIKLQKKLGLTRQGTHFWYRRWIGPVYIGCKTPGKRRTKTTQHLRQEKMLELAQTNGLPQSLKDVKDVASKLGYDVNLIQLSNFVGYSTTSLCIEGYRCLIKTRTIEVRQYHRNYILLSMNIKYLDKFDFVILKWDNERFIRGYYIIPCSELKENVMLAHKQLVSISLFKNLDPKGEE